jgi:hypothetical protein
MGASSQHPLTLHLQGATDKQQLTSTKSSSKSNLEPPAVNKKHSKLKPLSAKSIYRKCFQRNNSKSSTDEPEWRVYVSPDEETGESMQITMLASHEDMNLTSSSSASSEEDSEPKTFIVAAAAATGEKRGSKLAGLFKKKGGGEGDNNNGDEKQNNGDTNKSNGDTGNNNNNESSGQDDDDSNNKDFVDPLTYFGPERTTFAQESTLPLHTGSESTAPTSHPSWTPATGTNFSVRVGPNYAKTGKKEASLDNLYEVYCVRYFRSPCRTVGGATRIMPLPEMMERCSCKEGDDDLDAITTSVKDMNVGEQTILRGGNSSHIELKNTKIPDVLVVHFMLPYESPNPFKQKDDGPGGECVYYLRPSQRFLDEVSGKIGMTPATRLFVRWCHECQTSVEMRSRFKCMALVRDIEKHNMGLLKSYNGKPVLITESGRVCSGFHGDVRYLEMTANGKHTSSRVLNEQDDVNKLITNSAVVFAVHYWAFMAKKGFVSIIPKFKNMQ